MRKAKVRFATARDALHEGERLSGRGRCCKHFEQGFTLLEVLISMAVLAFISLGIYNATTETFRLRDVLSNEGDFYNSVRISMAILDRDVAMMYSPVLMLPPKSDLQSSQTNPSGNPNAPQNPATGLSSSSMELSGDLAQESEFWAPAIDKTGIRPMRFQGSEKKMTFVATTNTRIYKNSPESEFAKITYEIQPDSYPLTDSKGNKLESYMLVRTVNPMAFDMNEERAKEASKSYPLLHGITKFQFLYHKKDSLSPDKQWDSTKTEPKNRYPDYIEADVEVKGPTRLFFEGKFYFKPEVPFDGLEATF